MANIAIQLISKTDFMEINYLDTLGNRESVIATKKNDNWQLNKEVLGIIISENNKIIINHNVVKKASEINVVSKNGNSDLSPVSTAIMPIKQDIPSQPEISVDENTASVIIKAKDDEDKLIINYFRSNGYRDEVQMIKKNNIWSLNQPAEGFSLDQTQGILKINYHGVKQGSEIQVVATRGNSEETPEVMAKMPIKQDQPNSPIIEINNTVPSLLIKVSDHSDKIKINYTNPQEKTEELIVRKIDNMWMSDELPNGFILDKTIGTVVINYQGVYSNSEIKVTAKNGNSDESIESKVIMPIKQITPSEPKVSVDSAKANISIKAPNHSDRMVISYVTPQEELKELTVYKEEDKWGVNELPKGIVIDENNGIVNVGHIAVKSNSKIKAIATNGNRDTSEEVIVKMPIKEPTPTLKPIIHNDEKSNIIDIEPLGDVDQFEVNYITPLGEEMKLALQKIDNVWVSNKESSKGIVFNKTNGIIKIPIEMIQSNTSLSAMVKKGNSDENIAYKTIVSEKAILETLPQLNITVWQDEEFNTIKDAVLNDDTPSKDREAIKINGYHYIKTIEKDGITQHIYSKVIPSEITNGLPQLHLTIWIDENGKVVKDAVIDEEVTIDQRSAINIKGYKFIKTIKQDGLTQHIYKRTINKQCKDRIIHRPNKYETAENEKNQTTKMINANELPNTGSFSTQNSKSMILLMIISGLLLLKINVLRFTK